MHTEMNKNLVCRNEEIKYNNITNQNKKFNFDYITKEGIKKHIPNWPEIPDHLCRILMAGGCASRKANALLNNKLWNRYR